MGEGSAAAELTNVRVVGLITLTELEQLRTLAQDDHRTVSAWVRLAIREKIDREAHHDQSAVA